MEYTGPSLRLIYIGSAHMVNNVGNAWLPGAGGKAATSTGLTSSA